MSKKRWIRLLAASSGLGLCLAAGSVQAQHYQGPGCAPPVIPQYPCAPGMPSPLMPAPAAPAPAAPEAKKGEATTTTPTTPTAPTAPTTPEAATPPAADFSTAGAEPTGAGAGGGAGGGAPMLGRIDSNNRFNLFDNISAVPTSRVWFGWLYGSEFETGLQPTPGTDSNIGNVDRNFVRPRNIAQYRVGVEIALGSNFSIAAQDMYIASYATDDKSDAWGNPEFLLKWALVNNECTALSATLGVQTQASASEFELHEIDTRFYPGMLYYRTLGDNLFMQGGFQFGISSRNLTNTFDYALALGYWAYRDENWSPNGRRDGGCGSSRFIVGIIPQVEFYGKEVIANLNSEPFDISNVSGTSTAGFREPRHVYDVTVGSRVLFRNNTSVSSALSIPVTGGDVRQFEYMTTLNINF